MLCDLKPLPDALHDCRCTRCGQVFHDAQPKQLRVRCAKEGLGQPPLVRRLIHFGHALGKHLLDVTPKLLAGRLDDAYRTPDEIHIIYDTKCRPCPWFRGSACGHAKCGCHLGTHTKFLNKLAWKSEHCPDEPPKW